MSLMSKSSISILASSPNSIFSLSSSSSCFLLSAFSIDIWFNRSMVFGASIFSTSPLSDIVVSISEKFNLLVLLFSLVISKLFSKDLSSLSWLISKLILLDSFSINVFNVS